MAQRIGQCFLDDSICRQLHRLGKRGCITIDLYGRLEAGLAHLFGQPIDAGQSRLGFARGFLILGSSQHAQ